MTPLESQLYARLLALESQIAELSGPRREVFIASVDTGEKQWQERSFDNGTLGDFTDGRYCDGDTLPGAMSSLGEDRILLEVRDRDTMRYVPLTYRRSVVIRGTATKTGGADGSFTSSTTCAYVYTIADLDGNTLGTGKTPDRARIPNCTYTVSAGAQPALLYQLTDGTWGLIDVLTERPATTTATNITDFRVDDTNKLIQVKTTEQLILDKKAESDWTTKYSNGQECPEP